MTSKAQRTRRKKARISLAGGESAPQRPHPNDRTHTNQAEDARKTALQARCRQATDLMSSRAVNAEAKALADALEVPDRKARREAVEAVAKRVEDMRMRAANEPKRGDSVGRMILAEPEATRSQLWNAVYHARRTQAAYDRAIGAPSRHAQVARILAPVEAMHADASSPAPDFRTAEEKVRRDTAAQMRVEMWIGHCDNRAISAFKRSVINDPDGPVVDWQGVLNCLRCIVEGLAGQQVKARVRK